MVAVGITQYLTTVNDPRRSQVGLERVGRFVAPIVLSLICLGCAGSGPARGSQAPSASPLLELRFGTGWILLGTLDRPTSKWTERPSFRFPDGPEAENPSIPERDEVIQITRLLLLREPVPYEPTILRQTELARNIHRDGFTEVGAAVDHISRAVVTPADDVFSADRFDDYRFTG